MRKYNFTKPLTAALFAAFLCLGSIQAGAGPGGGTFYANSPSGGASGTAMRKFVDSLPGLGVANKNNLNQYIPVATPDTATYPGSDYYEIGLRDYTQKMHSDLPKATKLRGYYQINGSDNSNQYLGPLIIAKRYDPTAPAGVGTNGKPVRVKFVNNLGINGAGNLFIPVDTTLMGAGMGPKKSNGAGGWIDCDPLTEICEKYPQNRATLHLHGGNSPWISDGTPHQWTTPSGETTPFKKGVSTQDVPGMPAGDGEMTFYWTNQQSGRLMFYHDHSYGITRLNVYAGEAAGYLLYDAVEDDLIDGNTDNSGVFAAAGIAPKKILPDQGGGVYRYGIPLIIQDKTFVPKNIDTQDALWTKNSQGVNNNWGVYGDLWFPHVYEPNQAPPPTGANPFGRWDYGPWFWPPVPLAADKTTLPEPSTTPEGFHDTMLVNGTAYPYLTVEPKPYRFRILNASNDRSINLSLFVADPAVPGGKEVKMVTASPNPAYPAGPFPTEAVWPTDGREGGVPDPDTRGPNIIQIGSESGILPYPVVHPNQPVNYNYNRRDIVVLNVQEKNLFMGAAERADVIIDFSDPKYLGKNIILYNDSPAPVPAGDPRQDYYTNNPDQSPGGGALPTRAGYGPNTRTVMQFRVAGTPAPNPALLANLKAVLPKAFDASHHAHLVPESTLPSTSKSYGATELYARIQDFAFTFNPLDKDGVASVIPVTIPFQNKAIQELWDPYGRMNATLGVELPFTTQLTQTTIPMGYAEPTTEIITDGQPQIWKITHNGVDTHPVHFHMFDVQVVNRVGWDGAIRAPDENELGWKEVVRMNPLEDIIIALRPKAQTLPFPLPISKRAIDPTLLASAMLNVTDVGNLGLPGATATNAVAGTLRNIPNGGNAKFPADPLGYSFGYEYVWHCHILGHEENDFMRPIVFNYSSTVPPAPAGLVAYIAPQTVPGKAGFVAVNTPITKINQVVLQWTDGSTSPPSNFKIRRNDGTGMVDLAIVSYLPDFPPIYTDTVEQGKTYTYEVYAFNAVGNSASVTSNSVVIPAWAKATSVTLTPSAPSPHLMGTVVQFTANATGAPATVVPMYKFYLDGAVVQNYSTNNTYILPDTTTVGTYTISVDVSTCGGCSNSPDFTSSPPYSKSISYDIYQLMGDVNGDGVVSIADALLVMQFLSGITTLTPAQRALADVAPLDVNFLPLGGNGVETGDVLAILRRAVGMYPW